MIRRKKENIEWLEFELLSPFPEIVHGVFLRHGGVSAFPYDSLNIGGGTGDDPICIQENRDRVQKILDVETLISSTQVHKDRVALADDLSDNRCDGLLTQKIGQGLLIKHADCQAAIFFDPKKQAIGSVHCGWRGSVLNIYQKTVDAFQRQFGSDPKDLIVCISPSLGPEKAEFIHHEKELPTHFLPYQVSPNHFDFWEISKRQLLNAGIMEDQIEMAKECTFLKKSDFFSYRRDTKTGRHGTVVALKQT